jgi:hypothetical protein
MGERPAPTTDRRRASSHGAFAAKVLPPRSCPYTSRGCGRTSTRSTGRRRRGDQYILSSSWQASLNARNGPANPSPIE